MRILNYSVRSFIFVEKVIYKEIFSSVGVLSYYDTTPTELLILTLFFYKDYAPKGAVFYAFYAHV